MNRMNSITVKLGGRCNLSCSHCHCRVPEEYAFNPAVVDWIREQNPERINFGGGEPLMFFDTIKMMVGMLGDDFDYRFVTNGTLLTREIVDWCNDHGILVIVSYDGNSGLRDTSKLPRWQMVRYIRRTSMSCYATGSLNAFHIQRDVDALCGTYQLRTMWNHGAIMPHFVHETETAAVQKTMDDVRAYLKPLAQMIELQLMEFLRTNDPAGKQALVRAVRGWLAPKKATRGVACASDTGITVTLDGRFMICPYQERYCGDIEHGIDFEAIEALVPKRCRICPIFNICRNSCIANTTSHECFIARKMHAHLVKLEKKYGVDLVQIFGVEPNRILH